MSANLPLFCQNPIDAAGRLLFKQPIAIQLCQCSLEHRPLVEQVALLQRIISIVAVLQKTLFSRSKVLLEQLLLSLPIKDFIETADLGADGIIKVVERKGDCRYT